MKTNGMRMDSSSGGAPLIGGTVAGTPESITLSVDSLSQRQIYKGPPQNLQPSTHHPTWKRSPIVDITQDSVIAAANSSEYPPTQVKTATKNIPIIVIAPFSILALNFISSVSGFRLLVRRPWAKDINSSTKKRGCK